MSFEDVAVRTLILRNTGLEPWRVEMEEMDHGDALGCFVRLPDGRRQRFVTQGYSSQKGRAFPKTTGTLAMELSQQIKAAIASTPDNPMTVTPRGKIVSANGSPRTSGG